MYNQSFFSTNPFRHGHCFSEDAANADGLCFFNGIIPAFVCAFACKSIFLPFLSSPNQHYVHRSANLLCVHLSAGLQFIGESFQSQFSQHTASSKSTQFCPGTLPGSIQVRGEM